MHELGITTGMIEAIAERMNELGSPKVNRIVLEIGKQAAVLPDSIRFCFELCARGTVVDGAALEIIEMPGFELKIRELEVD